VDLKVGIITLYYKNYNFGGLLQAYALQQALSKKGFDCKQITYDYRSEQLGGNQQSIKEKLITKLKDEGFSGVVSASANKIYRKFRVYAMHERKAAFERFQEQVIPHTERVFSSHNIVEVASDFDVFICGSDQVWNLNLHRSPALFLDFVPGGKRKISYAASISMNQLDSEEQAFFQRYLPSFDAVSVRSEHERGLLRGVLPQKEVEVVLDPTLLLTVEDWERCCAPRIIEADYILCYFLGDSREHRQFAQKIAIEMKLPIVTFPFLHGYKRPADKGFGDFFSVGDGPEGFVSLIKHARLIITDSFHGCVFSILYHKDFLAVLRTSNQDKKSMNSRIYDLLQRFGLGDRLLEDLEQGEKLYCKPVDYTVVEDILIRERKRSLAYLLGALGSK